MDDTLLAPPVPHAGGVRTLARALTALGWGAGVWGVLYAINGATQAPAAVRVPVTLLAAPGAPATGAVTAAFTVPDGWLDGSGSRLTLRLWGSSVPEQVLSRGDVLLGGLALLVLALAVGPVLRSIAAGDPFAVGNPRRLMVAAGAIVVGGAVAPFLPQIAAAQVIARAGLSAHLAPVHTFPLAPLVTAALVLVLVPVFRAGTALTRSF
ncbi:hypothetical protein ACGIF2_01875 [Cellulomonas sp. P22]|uniref:hypothetical protein n=1 Tax=Cellulomonas sp. P22 TaxID=3373189 RepID=UPI0037BAD0AF